MAEVPKSLRPGDEVVGRWDIAVIDHEEAETTTQAPGYRLTNGRWIAASAVRRVQPASTGGTQ